MLFPRTLVTFLSFTFSFFFYESLAVGNVEEYVQALPDARGIRITSAKCRDQIYDAKTIYEAVTRGFYRIYDLITEGGVDEKAFIFDFGIQHSLHPFDPPFYYSHIEHTWTNFVQRDVVVFTKDRKLVMVASFVRDGNTLYQISPEWKVEECSHRFIMVPYWTQQTFST